MKNAMARFANSEHFPLLRTHVAIMDSDAWLNLKGKSGKTASLNPDDFTEMAVVAALETFIARCEDAAVEVGLEVNERTLF